VGIRKRERERETKKGGNTYYIWERKLRTLEFVSSSSDTHYYIRDDSLLSLARKL
jgi:hypothetical protein